MTASLDRQGAPATSEGAWLMVAELNHRIANELQAAMSALRLAKRDLQSARDPVHCLEEALVRLEGFGDVHQLLDRRRGQAPLARRLEALCRAISTAKAIGRGIHIRLAVDDVNADEEAAWTICVVASELMTNALKHAFPGGLPGAISVVLRRDGDGLLLTVCDNGFGPEARGRPSGTIWQSPGFGAGMVVELAKRLGGYVTRAGGAGGTVVTFRIPAAQMSG